MKNIFLLIFLLISLNSLAQKWNEVAVDKSGMKYSIKSSYLSKGGDYGSEEGLVKIWTKKSPVKLHMKNGKYYKNAYFIELIEFDCKNSKTKLFARIAYSLNGNVIFSDNFDSFDNDWENIVPDTVGETILNKVCELFN
jgi:hypothetical protein